jgi:hypothetical protein
MAQQAFEGIRQIFEDARYEKRGMGNAGRT